MGIIDRASGLRAATAVRLRGVSVSYRRKDGTTESVVAAPGRTDHADVDGNGGTVTVRSDDWLIRPEDFTAQFGAAAVPVEGDRITFRGRVYRLQPFGGEPVYRPSDQDRRLWRMHSKDIGAEE
ncbi:hypothetical protein Pan189_41380 [Stratiformator vulcanicus]|uniref:Phage head-tail joining protein domain-containing protein n=1 Tax=Stratiformator vulcanicus TaxID=2527980 RepID=A0A517R772_9PLAN|nr:hypothetical protein Pan189_41380 [Stratiformator vulcanicus]